MWNDRRFRMFLWFRVGWGKRGFAWALPLPVLRMLTDIAADAAALAARLPAGGRINAKCPLALCRDGADLLGELLKQTMRGEGLELSIQLESAGRTLHIGVG